jgi:hypothetical protein
MKSLLFIVLLAVVVLVVLAWLKRRGAPAADAPWPFYAKKPLTAPEQVLFHRMVAALPEHIVLAQVQLSRVLGVRKGFSFNEWNNRINRLTYDFLVCAKDASVIAAVELDDKTHERTSRRDADDRKARASAAAGVLLIRWNVAALPDVRAIQDAIAKPRTSPDQVELT